MVEFDPAWSPNRQLIAYTRGGHWCHAGSCEWAPSQTDIWVMAPDGASPRALTEQDEQDDHLDESPTWSPDSRQVAFARNDNLDPNGAENGIYVVGADAASLARRLSDAKAAALAWSPMGSTIAYIYRSNRHIGLLDVATGRTRRLKVGGFSTPDSLDWSPRGRFLAITAEGALFIVPASGGAARKVAAIRGLGDVSWSPDGCCLLFSAIPRGARSFSLYVVSVRGGRPRRLKKRGLDDFAPAWRP